MPERTQKVTVRVVAVVAFLRMAKNGDAFCAVVFLFFWFGFFFSLWRSLDLCVLGSFFLFFPLLFFFGYLQKRNETPEMLAARWAVVFAVALCSATLTHGW